MTAFRSYPKIYRLGTEETEGLINDIVTVTEKLDGASFSIFFFEGELRWGSKSRMIPKDEDFRGGQNIVLGNPKLHSFLSANEHLILYGELLVRHTILYDQSYYNKIYLFDVYDSIKDENWEQDQVKNLAEQLDLEYPINYGTGLFTFDEIKDFASRKDRGVMNEGVVIKSTKFINKFGDKVYGKYVNDIFKEKNNELFGNYSKTDPNYHELKITANYVNLARVQKIINKLESQEGRKVKIQDTPRIIGMTQHDVITEEAWDIFKSAPAINNRKLQGLIANRSRIIFHDILDNNTSVAYDNTKVNKKRNEL